MLIRYKHTLRDIYHADITIIHHSWRGWVIFISLIGITSYGLFAVFEYGLYPSTVFCLLSGPLGIATGLTARRKMLKNLLSTSPFFFEERTLSMDDNGIRTEMRGASSDMLWNMFIKVVESRKAFLVLYSPLDYLIIPKSAFADDDELNLAKTLLKKNTSKYIEVS